MKSIADILPFFFNIYTLLHMFTQLLFWARNKCNHKDFDPFLLPKKLWLIFMGIKQFQNGRLKKKIPPILGILTLSRKSERKKKEIEDKKYGPVWTSTWMFCAPIALFGQVA